MKQNDRNPVIITQDDFDLLKPYFSKQSTTDEMSLSAELSRASIVTDDAFPPDGVRLNSRVSIKEVSTGETSDLTIVLPHHADIKQKKVSILTPIAAALIGFRKGETVKWQVPAGLREFVIVEVEAPQLT